MYMHEHLLLLAIFLYRVSLLSAGSKKSLKVCSRYKNIHFKFSTYTTKVIGV